MQGIDTSVIYHLVRVQSVIKLYVIYNMLDVSFVLFLFAFSNKVQSCENLFLCYVRKV